MRVVIGSAFRNASGYVHRYMRLIKALIQARPDLNFRVVAAEGDSSDYTAQDLMRVSADLGINLHLIRRDHGHPVFGSTEDPVRIRELSKIGDSILDAVIPYDDILVYVESDLIWGPNPISRLIDAAHSRDGGFDIFSPLVFAADCFYDVWAFRAGGKRFSPFRPFHPVLENVGADPVVGPVEVDSVGSCLVMRSDVAMSVRMSEGALVGFCANAKAAGYRIAVMPELKVNHP